MSARDRVEAWLADRIPPAPAPLAERLAAHLRAVPPEVLGSSTTEAMGALGLAALRASLARGETGDEAALDLLAADAFVTYAFEAAAEEGVEVSPVAATLLARAIA